MAQGPIMTSGVDIEEGQVTSLFLVPCTEYLDVPVLFV